MGTELLAAGVSPEACLEELCVSQPDLVRGIHAQYIGAGSRVIETNSLGANAVRLAKHGLQGRVNEINWNAAQVAKDAAKGTGVYVAGSVGPLGVTSQEAEAQGLDRHEIYMEQIGALLDGGCNLIFLETFLDVEEMLVALNAKHTLHHCPVVALMALDDPARLAEAFRKLRAADADIVGVNCLDGGRALALSSALDPEFSPMAAFPSAGLPETRDGKLVYPTGPDAFAATGIALATQGVRLIGGCCGTGPAHIAALAKALQDAAAPR